MVAGPQDADGWVQVEVTLLNPPPVAAYPDQFELVLCVIFLFGSSRSAVWPVVAPAPAAAGNAVIVSAATNAISSLRKKETPFVRSDAIGGG